MLMTMLMLLLYKLDFWPECDWPHSPQCTCEHFIFHPLQFSSLAPILSPFPVSLVVNAYFANEQTKFMIKNSNQCFSSIILNAFRYIPICNCVIWKTGFERWIRKKTHHDYAFCNQVHVVCICNMQTGGEATPRRCSVIVLVLNTSHNLPSPSASCNKSRTWWSNQTEKAQQIL